MSEEMTYFVADAHLRPGALPEQNGAWRRLLERARLAGARIVLLGDFFNVWFERDGLVAGDYAEVLVDCAAAAGRGVKLHHVCGNRDFVVGAAAPENAAESVWRGFCRDGSRSMLNTYGIVPHGPACRFEQAGRRVHCLHGDSLCVRDWRYRVFRWGLQGPIGRLAARWLPWEWLEAKVERAQVERACARYKVPPDWRNIQSSAAAREVARGADLVFCGHVHHEDRRVLRAGGREGELVIVPPYVVDGRYAVLDGREIRIEQI